MFNSNTGAEMEVYARVYRERKKPKFLPKFLWKAGKKIGLIKKGKWTKKRKLGRDKNINK